jgi:hypothetical protein
MRRARTKVYTQRLRCDVDGGSMLPVDGLVLVGQFDLEVTRTATHVIAAEFSLSERPHDYLFLCDVDSEEEIDLRKSEQDMHWVEKVGNWTALAEQEIEREPEPRW